MGANLNSLSRFFETLGNRHIKSRIMATLENGDIFSSYYFSYVRSYKAALRQLILTFLKANKRN